MESIQKVSRNSFDMKTRGKVFAKSTMRCIRCGKGLAIHNPNSTVDHIIPISRGGTNKLKNLIGLCLGCNRHKGNRIIYPSAYFYMQNFNSNTLLKADEMVTRWAMRNVTLQYIMQNPFIYDEMLFTINSKCWPDKVAYPGYKGTHKKYIVMYKLEEDEVETCCQYIKKDIHADILKEYVKANPVYVFERKGEIKDPDIVESIVYITIEGSEMIINVLYTEHNKTLGTVLDCLRGVISPILYSIEIDKFTISGLSYDAEDFMLCRKNYELGRNNRISTSIRCSMINSMEQIFNGGLVDD